MNCLLLIMLLCCCNGNNNTRGTGHRDCPCDNIKESPRERAFCQEIPDFPGYGRCETCGCEEKAD